tara:strand:+ start:317 stop:775 length:459 start_codon:yes stop_codon:yes gene_type:complete
MATTTASLTLTSTDLFDDSLSISNTSTCYKAGTTIGLDQTTGLQKTYLKATTAIDLFTVMDTANAAENGKFYIANLSEDETEYVTVSIGDAVIGRLYAGDFMWMPYSPRAIYSSDIELAPSVATGMWIEHMVIHNFDGISPVSIDTRIYADE